MRMRRGHRDRSTARARRAAPARHRNRLRRPRPRRCRPCTSNNSRSNPYRFPTGTAPGESCSLPPSPRLSAGVCAQFQLAVTYRMFARLFAENCVPAGCAIACVATGLVEMLPVPPPDPHVPHVPDAPFPSRQLPAEASPVPNSFAGTSPAIKSDFAARPVSTYCFVDACSAATGFAGNVIGPVTVPPAVDR